MAPACEVLQYKFQDFHSPATAAANEDGERNLVSLFFQFPLVIFLILFSEFFALTLLDPLNSEM
jgi:hypothetical protein